MQQHQLNELIEPLTKLNSHSRSPAKLLQQQHIVPQQLLQQRPKDLPSLAATAALTNCNNVSPLKEGQQHSHWNNTANNANWNSDSWADGEFEPIDEPLTGNILQHQQQKIQIQISCSKIFEI